MRLWIEIVVASALALGIVAVSAAMLTVRADGLPTPPPPPQQGLYPVPVQVRPGRSCTMTALQLGYLTGRREIAYAGTEACMYFAGSRGVVMPYGFYGPYVPPGWVPPGWALPPPPGYGW